MDSFEAASFLGIGQSGPSTHINDGIRGRARRLMDASASSLEAVESLFNYATSGIPRPSGISRPEYYSPRRPNDDFSSSRSTLTSPSSLDEQAIDLEGGRQRLHSEWSTLHRSPSVCSWLAGQMYGPRLEERLRNPAIGGQAKYSLYDTAIPLSVFARFLMMVAWCVIILYYHSSFGVECKPASHEGPRPSGLSHIADRKVGKDLIYAWAQAGLATGSVFLLSHAYLNLRSGRERMERIRHCATTLAWSFLKATAVIPRIGHSRTFLQREVYEILGLLTAYPVALTEQLRGNPCEVAVTQYCREIARALQRMRSGQSPRMASADPPEREKSVLNRDQYPHPDYFYEVFSIHLHLEYGRRPMRTNGPSLASQQIVINLRNHLENLTEAGYMHERQAPIVRENIDMLAIAGREIAVFSHLNVAPVILVRVVTLAAYLLAFWGPMHQCEWLVKHDDQVSKRGLTSTQYGAIICISAIGAVVLSCLDEMWRMWAPFEDNRVMAAWTTGIAMEIDTYVCDFYERDGPGLIRRHGYEAPYGRYLKAGSDASSSSASMGHPATV